MTTLHRQSPHSKTRLSIAPDAIVLAADVQAGIADLPLTIPAAQRNRGVGALKRLVEIFDLRMIITAVPGAGGKVSALIPPLEAYKHRTPTLVRTTPNAFNDKEIRQAIEGSGHRTLLICGAATEVAVQLPALSAASEGINVHVIVDACAGVSPRTEDAALRRMGQAGVHISCLPTLIGELAGDFAEPKGQQAIGVLFELAGA